jgi:tellurium resistance protein TerD
MAVVLSKGGTVSLTKEAGGRSLVSLTVILGWEADETPGVVFDLDASALILDGNSRVISDEHFVFYNNLKSPEGGVTHSGDILDGDGDDEEIVVELPQMPTYAQSVVFVVSIEDAAARKQSFDNVKNASIRVVNNTDSKELARFDLSSGAAGQTALVFGEVYRDGSDWKFRALGDGHAGGFVGILRQHGVNV